MTGTRVLDGLAQSVGVQDSTWSRVHHGKQASVASRWSSGESVRAQTRWQHQTAAMCVYVLLTNEWRWNTPWPQNSDTRTDR